jgi:hypothetical protein
MFPMKPHNDPALVNHFVFFPKTEFKVCVKVILLSAFYGFET